MTTKYYSDDTTIKVGRESNKKTLKIISKLSISSYDGSSEYISVNEDGNVELNGVSLSLSSEDGEIALSDCLAVSVPAPIIEPINGEPIIAVDYNGTEVLSMKGKTDSLKRYAVTKLPTKGSKTFHSLPYRGALSELSGGVGNDPDGQPCYQVVLLGTSSYVYLPLDIPAGCIPYGFVLSLATYVDPLETFNITSSGIYKVVEDKTTGKITTALLNPISLTEGSGDILISELFNQEPYSDGYREYDSLDTEISFYVKLRFETTSTTSIYIRYWKSSWV
jgi:hypothetical protein